MGCGLSFRGFCFGLGFRVSGSLFCLVEPRWQLKVSGDSRSKEERQLVMLNEVRSLKLAIIGMGRFVRLKRCGLGRGSRAGFKTSQSANRINPTDATWVVLK